MTAPSPGALAALHAAAFAEEGRAWSAAEIADLLRMDEVFLESAPAQSAVPEAFAMARAAAGESELLTLAVAPSARRRGLGAALTARVAAAAAARGAASLFLEVRAGNVAARRLYTKAGFREVGRRRGYYGPGEDALVLRKELAVGALVE